MGNVSKIINDGIMSVFPKRVCIGDNVIIHVKCTNFGNTIRYRKIFVKVISPLGKEFNILDGEIWKIPPANSSGIIEKYYLFKVTNSCEAGRYFVSIQIKNNNKITLSGTKETDYFYVDSIKIHKEKDKVILKNESPTVTKIKLIFDNKIETVHLFGKRKIKISGKKLRFIMYGNNNIYELDNLFEGKNCKLKKKTS